MLVDWQKLPWLTALRGLAATAELRSFSRAARSLDVAHAAVSEQVRALEVCLGVPLVQKDNRGVSLTLGGEQLFAAVAEDFVAF